MQEEAPDEEYEPEHATHATALAALAVPAGHAIGKVERGAQKLPAGQGVQEEEPKEEEYEPMQTAHVVLEVLPVAALAVPLGHAMGEMAPGGQKLPAGQIMGTPEGQV